MLQVKLEKPTIHNSRVVALSKGRFAVISLGSVGLVGAYHWKAIMWNFRWYAYSTRRIDGTRCRVAMHRLLADTPPGEVCHHYNKNSLDNRLGNLLNQMPRHHRELHRIRRWGRKNQRKTTI